MLNAIFLGVLGRALRTNDVELVAVVCLSTHFHLLLRPRDAKALAKFMEFFTGNLTKKVNRLVGWSGPIFARRYQTVVVSDEEEAMAARLRYLLSHAVKENLVSTPSAWPGVESATPLCDGSMTLEGGRWFNGTSAHRARRKGNVVDAFDFPEDETVRLCKLPCWRHLDDDAYRDRVSEMVAEIEREAKERHTHDGTAPAGVHRVLQQDPLSVPRNLHHSPAPRFHAATLAARKALDDAYRWFEGAYREAAERLRSGGNPCSFPVGAFPPPQAFVAA